MQMQLVLGRNTSWSHYVDDIILMCTFHTHNNKLTQYNRHVCTCAYLTISFIPCPAPTLEATFSIEALSIRGTVMIILSTLIYI